MTYASREEENFNELRNQLDKTRELAEHLFSLLNDQDMIDRDEGLREWAIEVLGD